MFICTVCGHEFEDTEMHPSYIDICNTCAIGGRKGNLVVTKTNEDWQKIAETNSIEIYNRQPGETDNEWKIWQTYSGMYPASKPNLRVAANTLNISYSVAKNASSKWDYVVRLQSYKMYIDEQTMEQRRVAALEMSAKHIALANTLYDKVSQAVDLIDPMCLKPGEINNLAKTLTELEHRALFDKDVKAAQEWKPKITGDTGSDKPVVTKKNDLAEILGILGQAGALDNKVLGIETTTRVIASEDK